jgi:hypothetical protein
MVLSALTGAPRRELVMVTSAKRYLAIETMVVQRTSDWVRMADGR